MNWRIADGELITEHAENEDAKQKPDTELVKYARSAADTLASKLGGKDTHVEISGHETKGKGFTPGHVTISVSRLDPRR